MARAEAKDATRDNPREVRVHWTLLHWIVTFITLVLSLYASILGYLEYSRSHRGPEPYVNPPTTCVIKNTFLGLQFMLPLTIGNSGTSPLIVGRMSLQVSKVNEPKQDKTMQPALRAQSLSDTSTSYAPFTVKPGDFWSGYVGFREMPGTEDQQSAYQLQNDIMASVLEKFIADDKKKTPADSPYELDSAVYDRVASRLRENGEWATAGKYTLLLTVDSLPQRNKPLFKGSFIFELSEQGKPPIRIYQPRAYKYVNGGNMEPSYSFFVIRALDRLN